MAIENQSKSEYSIGLDVGSTTIKCVVKKGEEILYNSYERHRALAKEKTISLLEYIDKEIIECNDVHIAITGSSGLGISQLSKIPFVQEVYSTQIAVKKFYKDTDVVIELGGEDAKILFLSGRQEVRMNGSCAGGTGAFIDQMAVLLGLELDEFDKISLNYDKLYTIASRCGVFAKSDIQPLINQGAKKSDLAASIFQAVVNQTIGGLAQGREIEGKVVFLGGPLTFFKGLKDRFKKTLNLDEQNAVFPKMGQYIVAQGSAIYAKLSTNAVKLIDIINSLKENKNQKVATTMEPLFKNEEEYNEFLKRQNSSNVKYKDMKDYKGDAYLGVDAGSTTTKIVLITDKGEILYNKYLSNSGDAVSIVKDTLKEIYKEIEDSGSDIKIRGSASTGYGEELIKNAFNLDYGIVETVAHFTSARHFMKDVDFIIDIGGQDMKCFKLKMGAVDSIMLNEACSSGCGSFLETFATAMGYTIEEFAKLGLYAKHPVDLGSRCTVFMNSSVKQAQRDGASINDISAGLSISIVKNAVYKVIRANSPKDLGKNIVVQGGTFLNDAVLRAFEKELNVNVMRTKISGLMGAYGAALYCTKQNNESSKIINKEELKNFFHKVTSARCNNCENKCRLTINDFGNGKKFVSGNKCERYLKSTKQQVKYNMVEYKYNILTNLSKAKPNKGKIGIPLVLNMYENLPFWTAFFESLGYEVVLSPRSNRKLYLEGQHTIPSDTVCYPAKIAHGHIEELIKLGVDAIFYPCMTYNFNEKLGDNHYNCPVVAYYPEVLRANIKKWKDVKFIYDYIGIDRKGDLKKKLYKIMNNYFEFSKKEIDRAIEQAFKAYYEYKEKIKEYAKKAIEYANENNKQMIILAGRPYHIDPEINHGIDKLINEYGAVVLTEDAISTLAPKREKTRVLNQWTYHARLYTAARYVCNHDNVNLIQLVSFGCGVDAITTDEVRRILERGNKLYTQIKIDEINNLGATKIRIRSLFAAIEERKSKKEAIKI